jgi:hypothetical protein
VTFGVLAVVIWSLVFLPWICNFLFISLVIWCVVGVKPIDLIEARAKTKFLPSCWSRNEAWLCQGTW